MRLALAVLGIGFLAACAHETPGKDNASALTRLDISNTIAAERDKLLECHQEALDRGHGATVTGTLRTRFVIAKDGVVKSVVHQNPTDITDQKLITCVEKLLLQTRFPPPSTGDSVTVDYPFKFKKASNGLPQMIFGD
jgi:hypothetical protein